MRRRSIIGLVLYFLAVACGQGELTRDRAAEQIEQILLEQSKHSYALTPDGFNQGRQQGFWDAGGLLTEKGQQLFTDVTQGQVTPKEPPKYIVTVTGITTASSDAGTTEAQFTLSNDAARGAVRRFIIGGGTGIAHFRKFDDGWRGEVKDFDRSPQGLSLSASDQKAMHAELEADSQRRAELYRQATTATTTETFECGPSPPDGYNPTSRAAVSDVGVEFYVTRQDTRMWTFLYKDLKHIYVEDWYGKKIKMPGAEFFIGCNNVDATFNAIQSNLAAWREKWSGVDLAR